MAKKVPTFAKGDRVAFAAAFLRSIGDRGARHDLRGTVVGVDGSPGFVLAYVHWDGNPAPTTFEEGGRTYFAEGGVNAFNLVAVRQIAAEAATADPIPARGFDRLVTL